MKFDEKSSFNTMLGFTHGWDYKHFNEYISQKVVIISTTNRRRLECDVFDGSKLGGLTQAILSSFNLDEPAG